MIKKILRILLWSIAGLLLLFLSFMTGGVMVLMQIENQCQTIGVFSTKEDKVFGCIELVKPVPEIKRGVDS